MGFLEEGGENMSSLVEEGGSTCISTVYGITDSLECSQLIFFKLANIPNTHLRIVCMCQFCDTCIGKQPTVGTVQLFI